MLTFVVAVVEVWAFVLINLDYIKGYYCQQFSRPYDVKVRDNDYTAL